MLRYAHGEPVTGHVTDADRAREPRLLHVVAWYDGWGQAQGMRPYTYARRLDAGEAASWREGFADGRAARACVERSH